MEQSSFNTYADYAAELLKNNERGRRVRDEHMAFIILENDKLPWSWYKEKMTQNLYWNMQGGVTGAGSGHTVYFEKDLHVALRNAKEAGHTHAMLCQVGMLFTALGSDQIKNKSPVQNFYDFTESGEFMRSHLICHPGKPATIHAQHVEINLTMWNGDSIVKLGESFERSEENIHDDYTPLWLDTPNHPRMLNFTNAQRKYKRYLYAHRNFEKNAALVYDFIKNGIDNILSNGESASYIKDFFTVYRSRYYFENNEVLLQPDGKKYDVIYSPAAGLFAEYLYDQFGHKDTKTIIYDYNPEFLKLKKNILDYGFVGDEVIDYADHLIKEGNTEIGLKCFRTPNMLPAMDKNSELLPDDARRALQDNFVGTDHEYVAWDLINGDANHIIDNIEDKSVLFFASNIYQYVAVWMYCDYADIRDQYIQLHNTLNEHAASYSFYGKTYHADVSRVKHKLNEHTN